MATTSRLWLVGVWNVSVQQPGETAAPKLRCRAPGGALA